MAQATNVMQWFASNPDIATNVVTSDSTKPGGWIERSGPEAVRKGPHPQTARKSPSQPREAAAGPTPPPPRPGQRLTTPTTSEWASKQVTPKHEASEGTAPSHSSKPFGQASPLSTTTLPTDSPATPALRTGGGGCHAWALTPSDIVSLSDKSRRGLGGGADIVRRHLAVVYGAETGQTKPSTPFSGSTFDRSEPVAGKLKEPPTEWMTRKPEGGKE